jgi:hypothetical protein
MIARKKVYNLNYKFINKILIKEKKLFKLKFIIIFITNLNKY